MATSSASYFQRYAPTAKLATLVQCYWYMVRKEDHVGNDDEYMHPEGGSGIIFNLANPIMIGDFLLKQGCSIIGPNRKSVHFNGLGSVEAFGIRFHPGAGHQFFGLPLTEIESVTILPEDILLARLCDQLMNELMMSSSVEQWIAAIEYHLFSHLITMQKQNKLLSGQIDNRLAFAINWIDANNGLKPISVLNDALCLGQRQLDRLFKQHLGLAPKQYSRLRQNQYARHLLKTQLFDVSLTDIGYLAGFYDQAHFNHQFRDILGISPGQYRNKIIAKSRISRA
ncbi:helix-turn-helix domain-containing protein [Thalassotalea sp. 1_MG-2023]|nr:helix-turn-helix domain-containing protein [Thalassotalea sp. 1_MG-2023]